MSTTRVDLVDLFQNVTQALAANQQTLDQADDYNHNHGSNMVQTFQTVTNALEKKRGASASSALGYAAKTLSRQANSGSSQLYAQNLAEAATKFKGKRVNEKGALDLLQTLIGAQAGGQSGSQPGAPTGGDDMLGSLLGGLTGGGSSQSSGQGGLNLQNLLQAGMAYMQASQGGASTMQALVQAFVAGSGMGNARHRSESTQLVVSSFLQALGAQANRR